MPHARNPVSTSAKKKRRSSTVLEDFLEVSDERNKLLKEQHELTRADTSLNIKGKTLHLKAQKLQLYQDIRKGLSNERRTLRALKAKHGYNSDNSEAMEAKESIQDYKCHAEDAGSGLKNIMVEDVVVSSPVQPPASQNDNHKDLGENASDSESN
jgi:hypothetical protein